MNKHHFFLLAAFVVGAALWKAGVPPLPITLGIGLVGLKNLREMGRAGVR